MDYGRNAIIVLRDFIQRHNMVLVVGHGPSFRDFEWIREFKSTILSVDFSGKELVEHGIIPDYILFSEINEGVRDNLHHTLPDMYDDMDITFIHRSDLNPKLIAVFDKRGLKHDTFMPTFNGQMAVGNVGLYSIAYAHMVLKADEIHLIGLDYRGKDSGGHDYSKIWIQQAKDYLKHCKPNIIDHSNGDFPKS
jgi:hypothetical protein